MLCEGQEAAFADVGTLAQKQGVMELGQEFALHHLLVQELDDLRNPVAVVFDSLQGEGGAMPARNLLERVVCSSERRDERTYRTLQRGRDLERVLFALCTKVFEVER